MGGHCSGVSESPSVSSVLRVRNGVHADDGVHLLPLHRRIGPHRSWNPMAMANCVDHNLFHDVLFPFLGIDVRAAQLQYACFQYHHQ